MECEQMPSITTFYRANQVCDRLNIGRSTLYQWIARGEFPAPIKLGRRASAWSLSEIEAWEKARIAAARDGHSSEGEAA